MTDAELTAARERHGITVHDLSGGFYAADAGLVGDWMDTNQADAVCALLKARWGIDTGMAPTITDGCMWQAVTFRDGEPIDEYSYESELAAVVALADRLAGVTP